MTKRKIPSWQKARRRGHRAPRHDKRPRVSAPRAHRLALMLWSANGEPVTKFYAGDTTPPSHMDHGGLRYELVGHPDRGNRVAHYQTATIVPKVA